MIVVRTGASSSRSSTPMPTDQPLSEERAVDVMTRMPSSVVVAKIPSRSITARQPADAGWPTY